MLRSPKLYICLAFILLIVLLIIQTNRISNYQSRIEMVNPLVAFKTIQYGLVELEGEIEYQEQHNWDSAEQLILKTQFILEGIVATIETGSYTETLSAQDKSSLWNLHQYLSTYTSRQANHDLSLNAENKQKFQELAAKLRANGWGLNISNSSDWDDFMKRIYTFWGGV